MRNRMLIGALAMLLLCPLAAADSAPSELERLRSENAQLKAELASLKKKIAQLEQKTGTAAAGKPAATQAAGGSDVAAVEKLLAAYPRDRIPAADGQNTLRAEEFRKWVEKNIVGKTVTIRGKCNDPRLLGEDAYVVSIEPVKVPDATSWEASAEFPKSAGKSLLDLKKGDSVAVVGRIRSLNAGMADGKLRVYVSLDSAKLGR